MNKKILLLFSLLAFYLFAFSFIKAQNQMSDYEYQYEKYREVYQEFTTARDSYLTYKTLTSKDEALVATEKFLNQRYLTLKTYFIALKWRLGITPKVVGAEYRAELMAYLDRESHWIEEQLKDIAMQKNPTLEDLFILSDRLESKEKDLKMLSYQSLSAILLGKVRNLYSESIVITDQLNSEVRGLEATKAAQFRDWLAEVDNKNYLALKEIEAAESMQDVLKKRTNEKQMSQTYTDTQVLLERAKDYLNAAYTFQKEILVNLREKQQAFLESTSSAAKEDDGSGY